MDAREPVGMDLPPWAASLHVSIRRGGRTGLWRSWPASVRKIRGVRGGA